MGSQLDDEDRARLQAPIDEAPDELDRRTGTPSTELLAAAFALPQRPAHLRRASLTKRYSRGYPF